MEMRHGFLSKLVAITALVLPLIGTSSQSTAQTGRVLSVTFSPDGKTIAAVGDLEDIVTFWDTTTGGQVRAPEGLTSGVYSLAFSPDSKLIAAGLAVYGRRPRLWDTASGTLLPAFRELRDTTYSIYSVAFSPNGKTIASGTEKEIGIWDVATGNQLHSLLGHSGKIHSLAFSPDGKTIASGSEDRTIKLWDTVTWRQLHSLNDGWVTSLAFTPDGKLLISNANGNVRVWDTATGNELRSIKVEAGVNSVAVSPDGKAIAGACRDGTIRLWDIATGQQIRSVSGHGGHVNCVAFSSDGKTIASGSDDHQIRAWDAITGAELRTFGSPVESRASRAQVSNEIPKANWQRHPKIVTILKIVSSIDAGRKNGTLKTAERKFNCEEVPYFTLQRIARNSNGAVRWYEEYSEGEDSSWDYFHYYDKARRLRFVLIKDYVANGTREEFRVYFDESGKLIRQSRKRLKGPGYFAPTDVEELAKLDPAKEFKEELKEGCKLAAPKPKRRTR